MLTDTIAAMLLGRAEDDHPGLLFEDQSYSWAGIVEAASVRGQIAHSMRRPGPFHVGVLLDNVPEFVFWIAGAALSGAAVVGINPTRRGSELAHDIKHTDCQLLVTDREHLGILEGVDLDLPPERVLLVGESQYCDLLRSHHNAQMPWAAVRESDPLLLLFTSGSTGAPKAVVCSQGRLARIGTHFADGFGFNRSTTTYNAMPLFHGNALMANWAGVLAVGATFSMRARFSASGFLSDVRSFNATYFNYVGRALSYVLATPVGEDDGNNPLEVGFGTEASPYDREAFSSRFDCQLVEHYGSSEGALSIVWMPDAPPGALGKPVEGEDIVVADPQTGCLCPPAVFDPAGRITNGQESIGEIVGTNVGDRFEGYYNNPVAEAERMRGGWYWSGDLGYRDAEGWLYFAGRTSDWLRVDGENFAAAPVEKVLLRLPGVATVAVYPVPDPRTGDAVMAALEFMPGCNFDPETFAAFLQAQADLGTKWAPRFVRVVDQIPVTATNKVQKNSLRSVAWDTEDPVYWRPERKLFYQPLSLEDRKELAITAEKHGRLARAD